MLLGDVSQRTGGRLWPTKNSWGAGSDRAPVWSRARPRCAGVPARAVLRERCPSWVNKAAMWNKQQLVQPVPSHAPHTHSNLHTHTHTQTICLCIYYCLFYGVGHLGLTIQGKKVDKPLPLFCRTKENSSHWIAFISILTSTEYYSHHKSIWSQTTGPLTHNSQTHTDGHRAHSHTAQHTHHWVI